MFFLITPSEYEAVLMEEIWGCFKHMNIPLETIYSMPIMTRKFFIKKHNEDVMAQNEKYESKYGSGKETKYSDGVSINEFARLEQNKKQ